VVLNIKKVPASQMGIAFRFAGPTGPGINDHLDRRGLQVRWIKFKGAVDIPEVAADVGHYHFP